MNRSQMKSAIAKFKSADVSIIKDDTLRAKAQKLQAKQKGFTLLELLVVITLLATIATAGLVAYDGIGKNAQDVAASTNIKGAESSIITYRAIEGKYPEQWDNLANADGVFTDSTTGVEPLLADKTQAFFGQWKIPVAAHTTTPAGTVYEKVATAMKAVGIEELQSITSTTAFTPKVVPNLAWNESSPFVTADAGSEIELAPAGAKFNDSSPAGDLAISIVPSSKAGTGGTCTADGATVAVTFGGTTVSDNKRLNLINDAMDSDDCTLVLAVGFGKDVPGSTVGSRVAISKAPTAVSEDVNPAKNYARYIALFEVAEDENDNGVIDANEVFSKARLVGVVDPEGRTVDEVLAGANEEG